MSTTLVLQAKAPTGEQGPNHIRKHFTLGKAEYGYFTCGEDKLPNMRVSRSNFTNNGARQLT